jgi:hypothetical protein
MAIWPEWSLVAATLPHHDYHTHPTQDAQSLRRRSTSRHFRFRAVPAYEPNSNDGEYSQPFRHIQYNRTASRRPIATLAMLFASTRRQVNVPTFPVRMNARRCLGCLHQQEAQQGIALLAHVSKSLLASTGILTRDHPHVRADVFAALKPRRSSNDQHVGECRQRTDTGMRHQPLRLWSLPGFPINGHR